MAYVSAGPESFQRGMGGLGMPPFQAGVPSLQWPSGESKAFAQLRKHYNFNVAQLKSVERDSDYLDDQFAFIYASEHENVSDREVFDTFRTSGFRGRPQGKRTGQAHQQYMDGYQLHGNAAVVLNLPCINWILARLCQNYVPNENDYPGYDGLVEGLSSDAKAAVDKDFLPPIEKIVNMIRPIGGVITPKETRNLAYKDGPDIRVVCIDGACDVLNIWSTADLDLGTYAARTIALNYVGFILVAKPVASDLNYTMEFTLDKRTHKTEKYTKNYVWKVEPIILNRGTVIDKLNDPRVVRKLVGVKDEKHLSIRHSVHVWKVGLLGGPSNDSPLNPIVNKDASMHATEMAKLNKVELWMDYIGSHSDCI